MNTAKVMQVAWREFAATVMTKTFLFGLLIVPAIMALMVLVLPMLINTKSSALEGRIAVYDPTGSVLAGLRHELSRETLLERRREVSKRIDSVMPDMVKALTKSDQVSKEMDKALGEVPNLTLETIAGDEALNAARERLKLKKGDERSLLIVIEIAPSATTPSTADGALGSYNLFEREGLESRFGQDVRNALKQVIVDARLRGRNLEADEIRRLMQVTAAKSEIVSSKGTQGKNEVARMLLPIGFMILIMMAVMAGGQQLMTSTIEEKSSRVIEVLLAAVSPTELMAGKIVGQMAVGALMLLIYGGLMAVGLVAFSLLGMIQFSSLVYMLIFFVLSSLTIASLMAAIGAAVNEIREAQGLLTPVMLIIMLPMMFMGPIASDPNSTLATVLSFCPPVSPFIMMMRIGAPAPPPDWQVWLAILINAIAAVVSVWLAGKVFRIGLLMNGKPPNLLTLWRWVRMA
ncbi:MAG: ABC transporter permease [Ahniella sp.]|nr:ABC transporter permease [Ahniella sp.]